MNKKYHYVYRITNTKINKHYYGTRSSKIEPHKDLGFKYFSSSSDTQFREDQKNNPQDYKYIIVSEFDSREEAIGLEIRLHNKFNVSVNESFYNKAKQTSIFYDKTGIPLSSEHRAKMSKKLKGRVFSKETLEPIINNLIKSNDTNFKGVGQPLRIALTGSKFGPGIYDIIISLGKEEVIKRLTNKKLS